MCWQTRSCRRCVAVKSGTLLRTNTGQFSISASRTLDTPLLIAACLSGPSPLITVQWDGCNVVLITASNTLVLFSVAAKRRLQLSSVFNDVNHDSSTCSDTSYMTSSHTWRHRPGLQRYQANHPITNIIISTGVWRSIVLIVSQKLFNSTSICSHTHYQECIIAANDLAEAVKMTVWGRELWPPSFTLLSAVNNVCLGEVDKVVGTSLLTPLFAASLASHIGNVYPLWVAMTAWCLSDGIAIGHHVQ